LDITLEKGFQGAGEMLKLFTAMIFASLAPMSAALAISQVPASTITSMGSYTGASGAQGAWVVFSPAIPSLEGCSNTAGNQVWIDFSSTVQPDGKTIYATVLAAFLSGHTVGFGVSGCVDGDQLPLVYRVDLYP
jgi:hypothetical protein